jgi:hypothetical protein
MKHERKCQICGKHRVAKKDYRFIDGCGLQGRVIVCCWCFGLDDVAISDIMRDELDPKKYYEE